MVIKAIPSARANIRLSIIIVMLIIIIKMMMMMMMIIILIIKLGIGEDLDQ